MAAMLDDDGPGDAQAHAKAAGLAVARGVDAIERLEHLLQIGLGDARPAVADNHPRAERIVFQDDISVIAVFHRVIDDVHQRAPHRRRPARSAVRRVGKESVSTCNYGWWAVHKKKKT